MYSHFRSFYANKRTSFQIPPEVKKKFFLQFVMHSIFQSNILLSHRDTVIVTEDLLCVDEELDCALLPPGHHLGSGLPHTGRHSGNYNPQPIHNRNPYKPTSFHTVPHQPSPTLTHTNPHQPAHTHTNPHQPTHPQLFQCVTTKSYILIHNYFWLTFLYEKQALH